MSEARKALEAAIGKIGKAYGDLLKVAEKHGDDIAKEDYEKARYYLDQTIKKLWDKVDVVRDVAKATSGEFSLDSVEMPEMVEMKWLDNAGAMRTFKVPADSGLVKPDWGGPTGEPQQTPSVDGPLAVSDGKVLAKQIGGRLTKAAKAALAQSVKTELPESSSSDGDGDDGVDFIDD
jgi:hypothetical protein